MPRAFLHHRALVALLGSSLALAAAPALAQPAAGKPAASEGASPEVAAKVERMYLKGAALYRARKYRLAVKELEAAYALYPEPNLQYNIGRCYEALGQIAAAIKAYQTFIDDPKAAPAAKKKAKARLDLLKSAAIAASEAKDSRAGATPTRKPTPAVAPQPKPTPERPSKALTWSKWIVGALGLAAAGAGTALYMLGKADHDEVEDAKAAGGGGIIPMTRARAQELKDSGDQKKLVGVILWSVGGAALVASATFFLLDGGKEKPKADDSSASLSNLRVGALPLPGGGSVSFSASF